MSGRTRRRAGRGAGTPSASPPRPDDRAHSSSSRPPAPGGGAGGARPRRGGGPRSTPSTVQAGRPRAPSSRPRESGREADATRPERATGGPPRLLVIGTPIGNLGDLTARATESLRSADLVVCEDTRRTRVLLSHLSISRPTRSFHKFNEAARVEPLVGLMKEGKTLALVSDAGTPGVSDPGARLVAAARAQGIRVEAIPGPSAPAAALSISGVESQGHVFAGYPPARCAARRRFFAGLVAMERARREADPGAGACPIVLFEAPHRIRESLNDMGEVMGDRQVVLLREMTKLHEEALAGRISEVAARLPRPAPRGEITIVVAPGSPQPGGPAGPPGHDESARSESAPAPADLKRAYRLLIESGMDRKKALKRLATRWGIPKKEVYRAVLGGGGGSGGSGASEDPVAS